jgi:hypothetical protein
MKHLLIKLSPLLLLSLFCQAEELPTLSEIEVIEKFQRTKQKNDQANINAQLERIQRNTHQPDDIDYKKIKASGVGLICIPKGFSIINFKENIQFKLPKALTVRAYRQPDEGHFLYIIGKNDELKYKVALSSTEPLKEVTQMYEGPELYITHPAKIKKDEDAEIFKINHQIFMGFDKSSSFFSAALLSEPNALIGSTQRYGYSLSSLWDSPINVGAFIYWDNTSYEPGFYSSIVSRSLIAGLSLKSRDLYYKSLRFEIGTMFGFALQSKFSARYLGGVDSYELDQNILQIYAEYKIPNRFGDFSVGANYRKIWSELVKSSNTNPVGDLNSNDYAIGIYLAQGFESVW